MHPRNAFFPRSITLSLAAGALLASGVAPAKDCWLEVYDQANFQGAAARVEGPAELANLGALNGQNWSNRIESLKVGGDAEVVAYRRADFEDAPAGPVNHPQAFKNWGNQEIPAYQDLEISFGPGAREHHLGELKFHRNINSLKIRCRP